MTSAGFDRILARAAIGGAVVLVLVTLGIGALVVSTRARSLVMGQPGLLQLDSGYRVDDTIDVSPHLYSETPYTVIMFARSSCPACVASKPLFAAITERASRQSQVRAVMALSDDAFDSDVAFADEIGVPRDAQVTIPFSELRLRSVPTTVVVDRTGRVLRVRDRAPSEGESVERLANEVLSVIR